MTVGRPFYPQKEKLPDRADMGVTHRPAIILLLVLLLPLAVVAGCGDGRPERLEVSGQVLIDGKPLTYGSVRFVPKGARASSGSLDENGRFTLTCYGNDDGVVPGVHQVEVNAAESLSGSKNFWHAPKKYARFRTSPLTQEITESTDSLVINMTWDGGKPFTERVK
jgi:hypothetical protein